MWREVPFHLLPATTTESRVLSVPRGAGPWRLQALSGSRVSAWSDVQDSRSSVKLTLQAATDHLLSVTADGSPLEFARFVLVRPGRVPPTEILGFEVSDPEGRVGISLPAEERAAVVVSHGSRAARPFQSLVDMPPKIELSPGLTVSGYVLTPDGEPVHSARIEGLSFVSDGFGLMQSHRGRSAADGRFEIGGFFAGEASVEARQGDLVFSRTFDLAESLDLGPVVMAPPEVAWLRVVDSRHGTAIDGAKVRDPGGHWSAADEAGLLRVAALGFGRSILVGADGYLWAGFDLPRLAGTAADQPFVVRLTPAFSVAGVFVASDGATVAAGGWANAVSQAGGRVQSVAIGLDGSFRLDLPAGAYELDLKSGSAGFRRMDVRGSEGETLDLGVVAAPPSVWVRGHVLDENDYTAVAGATVTYARPSIFGPLLASALGNLSTVATDEEGYFELFGLDSGASTLRVEADGFARLKLEVEAPSIQGIDLGVVTLSRGRRVTVRSDVDEGTAALELGHTGLVEDRLTGRLEEGSVTFTAVPTEPFRVRVYADGVPVCEKDEDEAAGDRVVACDRKAVVVSGSVTRGGRPGDGMLVWRRRGDSELPEGGMTYGSGPLTRTEDFVSTRAIELNATLEGDGRYLLPAVLPGEWEVIWAPLSGGTQDVRSVTVPEAREVVLDFRYDGVSIEGVVLDPERSPVSLANVTVFPSRRTVSSSRNGRFEILGLAPGVHQLRARRGHRRSLLTEVALRDPTDREVVELLLEDDPPSEEIAITIVGGRSGFCFVDMDSSLEKVVRIDAGVARVKPDLPLPDRLRTACRTDGRWILDGWRDLRETLDEGLELDSSGSTSAIALVGEPADVQIIGPGGWDLARIRLWFGGAATFSTGETVSNLPVGEYVVRWGDRSRTVSTERRRTTEVELDS